MENLIGKILYSKCCELYQVLGTRKIKGKEELYYLCNDEYPKLAREDYFGCLLIPESEMKEMLENQECYKERYERVMLARAEEERKKAERVKREAKEKAERENLYGFDAGKTPMQRGKLLVTLLKSFCYSERDENGNTISKYSTRKDFIINGLKEGRSLEHKKDVKYYKKGGGYRIVPNSYRLVNADDSFYDITKTEYDFGKYLIENGIINDLKEGTIVK